MLLFLLPLVPYRVLIMLSDLEVHSIVYLIFSVTAESTYLTSSDTFPPISLLFPSSSPLLPPFSSLPRLAGNQERAYYLPHQRIY